MIAGLILKDSIEEESQIAFMDEEVKTFSVNENSELVELIKEYEPELVAANVGLEQGKEELTKQEQELQDEGFIFTPNSHREKVVKRLETLKAQIVHQTGLQPEFIRFEPQISAEELAIDGDRALESYGVDSSDIDSVEAFDAVVGAVTARFYQENQHWDLGVVVPEAVREKDGTESEKELDPRAEE
ncbi:hypothetical protein AQV86_04190 [Nanohaloarchaea archaeon SG9]|nr:hypothetical protein AQV86_04190 [Nanohaloarchaea archaeon SG9]